MNLCVCRYCVIYIYWIYWFIHLQYVLPWFLCVPAVWMRGLIHPETKHITTHSCSLYTWMGCLVSVWNDLFVVWKHGFNIVQQIWKEYVQSCWSKSNTIPWFPHDFMASDHTHTHTSFKRPGQDVLKNGKSGNTHLLNSFPIRFLSPKLGLLGHHGEDSSDETLLNHDIRADLGVLVVSDWPAS